MAIQPLNKTSEVLNSAGAPIYIDLKRGWRSTGLDRRRRPDLSYERQSTFMHQTILTDDYGAPYFGLRHTQFYLFVSGGSELRTSMERAAYNVAYGRFSSLVGDRAENLTSLLEMQKTADMIGSKTTFLANAWKAWRRKDLRALQKLGLLHKDIDPKQVKPHDWRASAKKPGKLWLEFWMGWAPLVGDVQTSMNILTREFPASKLKASGRAVTHFSRTIPHTYRSHSCEKWEGVVKCYIQAGIRITNPNLYLANQLGLINPPLSVWQATPWSWLLGWVVNIEQVLNSYTEFFGLELVKPLYSVTVKAGGECDYFYAYIHPKSSSCRGSLDGFSQIRRVNTIGPGPTVHLKWPAKLSLSRAATGVSFLSQQLNSTPRR